MARQYRSPVLAAFHATAEDLHAAGLLDKQTMREFDETCLTTVVALSAEDIRSLRESDSLLSREVRRATSRHAKSRKRH